jgi:glutathione synthase
MLKIAIQMDPIEHVDVHADTSFDLAFEAFKRGHKVYVYGPEHLQLNCSRVLARIQKIGKIKRKQGEHVTLLHPDLTDLSEMDVILIRQDPPFNMAYITAAQILERLTPSVLVLNDPRAVRDAPEKLFVTEFEDLTPPTLITRDVKSVKSFREEHGDIIIKPLYGNGGESIFHVKPDDGNFNSLIELFLKSYEEPKIAQKFIPEISKGDKRIILLDGKPVGAINRIPSEGETRSNLHVGGKAEAIELNKRDQEICDIIGPVLSERGLIFAGIDVIGNYLTEINVTSPTGVQEIRNFGGNDISALFWDWAEEKLKKPKAA